jgi:hypothetical protein
MLKTYTGDLKYVERLIRSFNKYNSESLPLFVVLPESQRIDFEHLENENVQLISEEKIPTKLLFQNEHLRSVGYLNQQAIKLGFHRMNLLENYLCLDSDGEFLRPIKNAEFFDETGSPLSSLVDDKDLQSNNEYFSAHWKPRSEALLRIKRFLSIDEEVRLMNCHGFQLLQTRILQRMEQHLLVPKGWDFLDLVQLEPYEFTWYNYFLQKTESKIAVTEPWFKYIHSGRQLTSHQLQRTTKEDFARGYVGLVVNSNFQHFRSPAEIDKGQIRNLFAYQTAPELIRLSLLFLAALTLRLLISPLARVRRYLGGGKNSCRYNCSKGKLE